MTLRDDSLRKQYEKYVSQAHGHGGFVNTVVSNNTGVGAVTSGGTGGYPQGNTLGPHIHTPNIYNAPHQHGPLMSPPSLYEQLRVRLRIPAAVNLGFDTLHLHEMPGGKVAVFVVQGDQAQILYDDEPLFPSDALITQLRLIMDAK